MKEKGKAKITARGPRGRAYSLAGAKLLAEIFIHSFVRMNEADFGRH